MNIVTKPLVGRRFTRLTVLADDLEAGEHVCRCRCTCGNEVTVAARHLLSRNTRSCGCLRQALRKPLLGQQFGLLTVVDESWADGQHTCTCRCACGNEVTVAAGRLAQRRSCGCARGRHDLPRQAVSTFVHRGERLTVDQLVKLAAPGISAIAVRKRLRLGWSVDRALTEPLRVRRPRPVVTCPWNGGRWTDAQFVVSGFAFRPITVLRKRWRQMIARCTKPTDPSYRHYGGAGVAVDQVWLDVQRFINDLGEAFIVHALRHGVRNTTLDRVDGAGDYSPINCR